MVKDFSKVIVSGLELERDIISKRQAKVKSYYSFGFSSMNPYIRLALGYPIYLGGYDGHGKSEFLLELQMQLSELYGMKHLVFSGEIGSPQQIITKLCSKYGKKPFNRFIEDGTEYPEFQTDDEAMESLNFVNQHFLVVDRFAVTDGFRFDNMIETLNTYMNNGFSIDKVDTISIDSWYELDREEVNGTDRQLEKFLQKMFRYGYANKISFLVSSHIGAAGHKIMHDIEDTNQKYPGVPSKYNWTGGMMWSRMGFQIINGYKPHDKVCYFSDDTRSEWNEFWVDVEKSKPERVGKKGRCTLFFNPQSNRYYELIDGEKKYSRDWQKEESDQVYDAAKGLEPNVDFSKSSNDDDLPF